jgi:c-di-GMP-binding flagellar brake protein YcgR
MCRYVGETEFLEVTTLNISQSGMLVRSTLVPNVGAKLEFKFLLETGFEILSGTGTVMRLARDADGTTTVGIAFDEIDPPKQRILARVIELHSEPVDDSD